MKIIVFNAKKWYPLFSAVKITAILLLLFISAGFATRYVLDTELYISAAADTGEDKIIILDAGHGGEDCGAVGVSGIYEKTLNLEIVSALAEELTARGYAVVLTRTDDRLLYSVEENVRGMRKISDLKNRVAVADKYPDAIFLSIHMNSYKTEKYSGFQAYFNGADTDSRTLAAAIQKNVRERVQPENGRVIKDGGELYILKNAPTVTALLECGFISNAAECEKLSQKEYQKELSFAIVCGIIEYIEQKNLQ